jgi:hypothetical protein
MYYVGFSVMGWFLVGYQVDRDINQFPMPVYVQNASQDGSLIERNGNR